MRKKPWSFFSCLILIGKLGTDSAMILNIWTPQANTNGPYLFYPLGYHSVSQGLRLLDCQVFQWENQRAQDKRIPRKMSTIMINSAVGYLGKILIQRAESF